MRSFSGIVRVHCIRARCISAFKLLSCAWPHFRQALLQALPLRADCNCWSRLRPRHAQRQQQAVPSRQRQPSVFGVAVTLCRPRRDRCTHPVRPNMWQPRRAGAVIKGWDIGVASSARSVRLKLWQLRARRRGHQGLGHRRGQHEEGREGHPDMQAGLCVRRGGLAAQDPCRRHPQL